MNLPVKSTVGACAAVALVALALLALGCSGGKATGTGGKSTGTTSTNATSTTTATGTTTGTTCTDPLHTGLTAVQTGISVDAYDCDILAWAAKYNEPDPMIFKAIIYVESRFDNTAVACPNDPCTIPPGWTAAESGCFGLMQYVLACVHPPTGPGFLPTMLPDLVTDPTSPDWASSIFNPSVNIELGIGGVAYNRTQVEKTFPGCTVDQYTMMAVGNYNSYGSTKSCTVYNTAYDDPVIMAYNQYATAAGYPAHSY